VNPQAAPASGSRLGLTRERILEAALDLLDQDGLGALSMRRLAEELGVGTMTLYGYFRSKEELLDAAIDMGARRIGVAPVSGSWRERLRHLVLEFRRGLAEHPGIVELRLARPVITPGALELTEAGMEILRDAGFAKRDAARGYRTLFVYVFGFSAFGPGPTAADEREQVRDVLATLPSERYPRLVEAAEEAAEAMADDTLFDFGLDRLLDGLERELARAP
jgi:AcrR family transcriptional regulator